MTREEIISGLQFTIDMFLFDPNTGEKYTEPRNDMDKTTIEACRGAIELLKQESEIPTGSIIDWNNCHTSEQIDSITTTKNDLAVDCIDRAELLKAMDTWDKFGYTETGCFVREPKGDYVPYVKYDDTVNCVKGMPPVTPIRPKGHWIPIYQGDEIIGYRCSECEFGNTFGKGTIGMNFCPNCGAKMEEEE